MQRTENSYKRHSCLLLGYAYAIPAQKIPRKQGRGRHSRWTPTRNDTRTERDAPAHYQCSQAVIVFSELWPRNIAAEVTPGTVPVLATGARTSR